MAANYTKLSGETVHYSNTDAADEYHLFRDVLLDLLVGKDEIRGIEIGVLNGQMSRYICSLDSKIKLIGIDPIIPDSMEASLIGSEAEIAKVGQGFPGQFSFLKDRSWDVSPLLPENHFSFSFIDGDHRYESVRRDYMDYWGKLVAGGVMLFHDSRMNRGGAPFHVGPSRLVDEIARERGEPIAEAFSLSAFRKIS